MAERRRRRAGKPAPKTTAGTTEEQPEKKSESLLSTIIWALVIAFVVKSFIIDTFWIPSGSMEPTLDVGDFIVVTKWSYGYNRHSLMFDPPIFKGQRLWARTPKRGDVVVFDSTTRGQDGPRVEVENGGYHVIKRVIGLPGDKVTINDTVIIVEDLTGNIQTFNRESIETGQRIIYTRQPNGTDKPTPVNYEEFEEINPEGKRYVVRELSQINNFPLGPDNYTTDNNFLERYFEDGRVPQGHIFVMGDNRDQSGDSRASLLSVPMHKIVGKAQFTVFSLNDWWLPRWDRFFRPIR